MLVRETGVINALKYRVYEQRPCCVYTMFFVLGEEGTEKDGGIVWVWCPG